VSRSRRNKHPHSARSTCGVCSGMRGSRQRALDDDGMDVCDAELDMEYDGDLLMPDDYEDRYALLWEMEQPSPLTASFLDAVRIR
jgi:hypothetical protein